MKTYFISGHLDLTEDEFNEHYGPIIDLALSDQDSFVIGDARGADTIAQAYLTNKTSRVIVYHMFESPRNNVGDFPTIGGFRSDNERDSSMTQNSDHDIAWVRPGRKKSGTAKNIERRKIK